MSKKQKSSIKLIASPANFCSLEGLDFSNLSLCKSGRSVKLVHNKQCIAINTGTLYMPFNINKFKKQWSNFEEYTIDCYVTPENKKDKECYSNKLSNLNNHIFEMIKNNKEIMNIPDHVIEDNITFTPFYKNNKTFPKLLKLHLPRDTNGNFTTQFFDENSNKIIVDETNIDTLLKKKSTFKTIMGCSKVYFYQDKAGCIWDILQIKFVTTKSNTTNTSNNLMIDDDLSESSFESSNQSNSNVYTQMSLIDD